ncbi:MAG: transposase [Candidatus Omnitrophica bacterium]|nr:transposase [Candidatus Omnitrophota bacterium]
MPRTARFIQDNGYYHVISRSINQTHIFRDPEDFSRFRKLQQQAKRDFPLRLFHYVIMHTHFHFVLQATTQHALSAHLAQLKWRYTIWMRRKYGWKGPLWRERYKSLPIESEEYLTACGTYVEFNPIRAGLCKEPAAYPHSSYRHYHLGVPDELLDPYLPPALPPSLSAIDYSSETARFIFSAATAIGGPAYLFQRRPAKNACPQK